MLPNFLHAGAPKCASSWIWRVFKEHPEIYVPDTPDNVNFFTVHYHRGLKWYEQTYFPNVGNEKAVGEFSNSYMVFEPALERIAHDLPGVLLTMTIRHPVDRAYLNWAHIHLKKKKYGLDPAAGIEIPLAKALHHHGHQWFRHWIEPGMYAYNLKRIYRHFPKDRVWVSLQEDLRNDPVQFLEDYFARLGVDTSFRPSILNQETNPDADNADPVSGMNPELRAEMIEVYRPDILELQDILDRDLSDWLV